MKTKLYFITLFLFLFVNLKSQSSDFENSIFWEISGNGLKESSYIFGTIHIIPKNDFFMPKIVMEKFKSCKSLTMELDLNIPFSEQLQLASKMRLPYGKTIEDYMNKDEFDTFKNYTIDSLGMSENKFTNYINFKPFVITGILYKEFIKKPQYYEVYFNKKAKKYKLEIKALESIEEQLDIFEKIPLEVQCKMFFNSQNPKKEFFELVEIYKKQEINKLSELSDDTVYSDYENIILIDRNKKWIPLIKKIISEQSTFIAVGAAHLGGEYGVLNLLIKEGYTVKPLK